MYNTESGRVDYRTSEESVLLVGNGGSGWSKGPGKTSENSVVVVGLIFAEVCEAERW